jgi:hypothetical protein
MRLTPHPSTPWPANWQLTAQCAAGPTEIVLRWTLQAELARIRLPPLREAARRDGLWRHTCFELFVADPAASGYREFNFSPSSEWAAFSFTRYRDGIAELALEAPPVIGIETAAHEMRLTATLPRTALVAAPAAPGGGLRCALAAVIEQTGGAVAYLALAHPSGRPDFHHRDGFVARIDP